KNEHGDPLALPREGIEHSTARLATVQFDAVKGQFTGAVTDCRLQFPPLTDIWASDVKFDNGNCKFDNNAKTVQQAIDDLCAAQQNACCAVPVTPKDLANLQIIIDNE